MYVGWPEAAISYCVLLDCPSAHCLLVISELFHFLLCLLVFV